MAAIQSSATPLADADLADYQRLAAELWRSEGVAQVWIDRARENGMDAKDAASLSDFTRRERYLIIVRCPKAAAHSLHRVINRPKPVNVKTKSLADGVVRDVRETRQVVLRPDGRTREVTVFQETEYTSDYDLMCVYKVIGSGQLRKIVVAPKDKPPPSAPGKPWTGAFTIEARDLMRKLNNLLVVKLRHGCQDDMHSRFNPGVSEHDRFAAFHLGEYHFLASRESARNYYETSAGIDWQYGPAGNMLKAYR